MQTNNDEIISKLNNQIDILSNNNKKAPIEPKIESIKFIQTIIQKDDFVKYEPFLIEKIYPYVLKRLDDKPIVSDLVINICLELVSKISTQIFPYVISILLNEMLVISKKKSKLGSLQILLEYIKRIEHLDKDLLSSCLPVLIPAIKELIHDTNSEISDLATDVMTVTMNGITNRDLEPLVNDLISAMKNIDETNETIQKLASVVFVQTMEGSALAVIIPLILSGFRNSKSLVKRMCSRIVGNMSKLLEDPTEGLPFFEKLIPAMHEASDSIPDPEARSVAVETHKLLVRLKDRAEKIRKNNQFRDQSYIFNYLKDTYRDLKNNLYISYITSSLIMTKTTEKYEYIKELTPYLDNNDIIEDLYNKSLGVINFEEEIVDDDNGDELCNCEFTLAYGTKVLLHNTRLKLIRGKKYGLLGQNDCGKTTLMRAIADGSLDGFPDQDTVRTVFVEADIQGELSHLNCVDYVLNSPSISNMGATEEMVRNMLKKVGFSEGKMAGSGGDCDDPISSLSGGWRMKLALARAMLQKADIILMDEPTNHLDVKNVKWVKEYINSLKNTTVIMVSHDSGLLDDCCDYILQIDKLKLKLHKGNLSEFVKSHPEAQSYFEFKSEKFKFTFPKPSFLEGVKSRGKILIKMDNVSLTYPGNNKPTISNISVKASMASRVACVGVNGAGKSTMIKVLTGELEPTQGSVWKYNNAKIGYIAQHAFHHIENHLDKTPNEYIRWRYAFGNDREGLDKASMKLSDSETDELQKPILYTYKTESGQIKKEERVISRCSGQRRECDGRKKEYEYEVIWKNKSMDSNSWIKDTELIKYNKIYEKIIRMVNQKIDNQANMMANPLTQSNVEKHLENTGLEPEYGTHFRINALSGGQKVKVVLAAAMWDQPHILILDEPTNYLDRDSLGALADAIERYDGGIIMITHNDAFCRQLCPERWVLENGNLNTEGDIEWMNNASKQDVEFQQIDELVDASGNEIKIKKKKKLNSKEKKKLMNLIKKKIEAGEDLYSDEEEYAIEWNL